MGDAAYGYIVFTYSPNKEVEGDMKLCKELFAGVDSDPSTGAAMGRIRSGTYWPLKEKGDVELDPDGCAGILEHYDDAFARDVAATLPASRRWEVFLMAQAPVPFGMSSKEMRRVCVDLTKAREESELRRGLHKWRELMKASPEKWGSSGLADYLHKLLTFFMPKGNVHIDCK